MTDGKVDKEGGTKDVVIQRLEGVEKGLAALSNEFTRLAAESISTTTKIKLLEENDHRHDESINQIKESTIKMEIQFSAIMAKFDSLESKIFTLLQQAGKDSSAERKMWLDLLKYVIGITVGVMVANMFLGK
ncbi:hypothetical protein EJP77_04915 [Paenibacillus zeisoli]|uniref:Uncharacterized protein n=1 Tax=Paenibacillus zeisoli TaxID=2496267 RepID=A0A433XQK5_9BACL|nr:hypothetical protein [Paenibacillus zeisoli]RUT36329.1 hypothetical protein EJP77_04915 [Paenibacillus zeisoli]